MAKKQEKNYLPATVQRAQEVISEGRKELNEATNYMDQIKTKVANWQAGTKDFFGEVTDTYEAKKEEIERTSSLPIIASVKAMWETLPSLIRREDPKKKRFGRVLNSLVSDADRIFKGLGDHLDEYEERFDEIDKTPSAMINEAKEYRKGIEEYNNQKKDLEKQLGELELKLSHMVDRDEEYLKLRGQVLDMKRNVESVRKERSSALSKYQQIMNNLDAIEVLRDEYQILLSEGRNVHETLETTLESLRPLFDHITASADLVEFQRKALDTYEMLRETFNPAMIAITAVAKGVSKVAAETKGQLFIKPGTITAVKQLSYEHKGEIKQRDVQEEEYIEELLRKKEKEDAVDLKEGKDYHVISEEKQEPTEGK